MIEPAQLASEATKTPGNGPLCLSIDLEVGIQDERIHSFAAVRGDNGTSFVFQAGNLQDALRQLDAFAGPMAFLLGHNIIAFDAPHLAAAQPDLRLLKLPMVDTLQLNPLAFPRNPYHHLVKHYKDGKLQHGSLNDPELDARLTLEVFSDQLRAFEELQHNAPDLLLAWHWLTTITDVKSGLNAVFMRVRRCLRPTDAQAHAAILRLLSGQACQTHGRALLADARQHGWPLAYALSWLSVSGGNSVMPPWVRHQFPQAGALVRLLRDSACGDPGCDWCSERHDARRELKRFFNFDEFRPEPADADGRPLQQAIVEAALAGKHVLGILPTGTGKSLCYQIPALSRYDKTGALTVVISPLVALMSDQVAGLEARGITCCVAINGLLSMPERRDALDRIRLGDAGILIIAPEQLRSKAVRKVLEQREIGAWVLDEAHCISKWGQDFRPDYRYVSRFIKEKAQVLDGTSLVPPILCLTATAKPDVVADMIDHFRNKVGIELMPFNGGANRTNLDFSVMQTTQHEKFAHIHQLLLADLPPDATGGAIVYCASRRQTEEVTEFLLQKGMRAGFFHAGLQGEAKKATQAQFIHGELQVIAATNAFGMGIDKPDVRLVIHADIPGSLENYLQEAGRAGRDRDAARCVLLYTPEDVERQFGMSARSRLSRQDIQAILKSIRRLERKKQGDGEVIATSGEILSEETDGAFERDSATDDTRVRTAIAWLEEATLLTREENRVQVFPSSLRVSSLADAEKKLDKANLFGQPRQHLLSLVRALFDADADEGISTDELMCVSGLSAEKVRAALYDLEKLGIASNDTALTAFIHAGVKNASKKRLEETAALEIALIAQMREAAPDLQKGEGSLLQLRHATQRLKDAGHSHALPEKLARIIRSLASDGRNEDSGLGSIRFKNMDAESIFVTLQRNWQALEDTAALRRTAANVIVEHLLSVPRDQEQGVDLLAQTSLGQLLAAIDADITLKGSVKEPAKLLDRALLWLHEQEVIRLNKGLAVFRPAMSIHLGQTRQNFLKADFTPLKLHYDEQVVQIHVMAEYVQRGLKAMAEALGLAMDYFSLSRDDFMRRWLPEREKELARQTTPASWRSIVEDLNNPIQQRIVTDDREQTNVLVLAGPGSGKTRVLVHRIAYLVRVKRENPHGILALAYNRHAAVEIRRRLDALIGDDARGVIVLTCHALAMRLAGVSLSARASRDKKEFEQLLKQVIPQAVALLNGSGLPPDQADAADAQRDRLLAAFRWILVDEYQDIGPDQYALISALAGRTRSEEDGRLSLFAVGDDDQNIYAFNGSSVEFIRRFETDYAAKPSFLIENYRSTHHIIDAANLLIAPAVKRMKAANPVMVNRARNKAAAGGAWQALDPVGKGRVQILSLPAGGNALSQAVAVMTELMRLASLAPDWDWSGCAVISRNWDVLEPVRSFCALNGIPVQMANEDVSQFWRLRETQNLVAWLRNQEHKPTDAAAINAWLALQPNGRWWSLLQDAVSEYALETSAAELPTEHFIEWLVDWGREARRKQTGLLLLTAHRAKGLEFAHVAVLDGDWQRLGPDEDADAPRRLLYVAMTRAKSTLTLARMPVADNASQHLIDALPDAPCLLRRATATAMTVAPELLRRYARLTMKDIDIGFAGRFAADHPVHRAIAALSAGDALALRQTAMHWELADNAGVTVGRLSKAFAPPANMHCISAQVAAIVCRKREDGDPAQQNYSRCDQWEIVMAELVFAP